MSSLCPCGSGSPYTLCCQSYLYGERTASTPQQLMRSRYSAYVMKNADYLVATWHERTRHAQLAEQIIAGFEATQWLGLTVYEATTDDATNEGYVSFVAHFADDEGTEHAIIERSHFLKEQGKWYYLDGLRPHFGRNDPCPCGSGNKFKKCCGR